MFGRRSKGQMFLIGSIVVVVVMVLIRTAIDVSEILEKKKFLEAGIEKLEFENLRREVPKAAFNAVNFSRNMTNATNSFIAFAENKFERRIVDLDGVSISSAYGTLAASTNIPLNVTVYNFFDVEVSRAVLNLSTNFNSPVTLSDIEPGKTKGAQFTLNLASNQNLTLWAFYETSTEKVVANITIPARIGKEKFVGYFDLRMSSERGDIRDRFFETVDIN